MNRPAYLYSPQFCDHDPPPDRLTLNGDSIALGAENVSNARLTAAIHALVERSHAIDDLTLVEPEPIDEELLHEVHDPGYLRQLDEACAGGAWNEHSASVVPRTAEVARLTAGAVALAVRLVLSGSASQAFVNARPSGHHAERDRTMGNCFVNNVACGAAQALESGCARVMIVDWDVHTGNGAHQIFWDRDEVLALSIHQERWYPRHAGRVEQIGGPTASGTTVNVPLPPGTNDAGYALVLEAVVRPIAERYEPELVIVAAGQDPSIFDPMGRMMVSAGGFRAMGRAVRSIAEDVCGGRLVGSVEGGYSHMYSSLCALAALEGLLGLNARVPDPYAGDPELDAAADPPSEAVLGAVAAVKATHRRWFS